MNVRVLRIELRRSVAPWAGAVTLTVSLAFLYLLSGPWWKGTALWTTQWTSMALWTRFLLVFLWPLAMALGALQGLRDHRSRMSELLTSTPRPARHRAATTAGATAITLASAFALLVLLGAVSARRHRVHAPRLAADLARRRTRPRRGGRPRHGARAQPPPR